MYFVKSPSLICLESTKLTLTFSHFSNIFIYNTRHPQFVLKLLSLIDTPKTIIQIKKIFLKKDLRFFDKEIKNLQAQNFILNFSHKSDFLKIKRNKFLEVFVQNKRTIGFISQNIQSARIGIVDLLNQGEALRRMLLLTGYKKIDIHNVKDFEVDSAFLKRADFLIVLGTSKHKYYFSKLNKEMIHQKNKWLLVTFDNFGGTVGPIFGSGGGPCFDCTIDQSYRQFGNMFKNEDYHDLIEAQKKDRDIASNDNSLSMQALTHFVVIETTKIILKIVRPKTLDGYYNVDMFNFRIDYNHVSPSPTCPTCVEN